MKNEQHIGVTLADHTPPKAGAESMNYSTEPDADFEHVFVVVQHVCGATLHAVNSFVVLLIIIDDDSRNKHYRKYLCFVQVSSIAFDSLFDLYSPIVLIHKGLVYSDSYLSRWISMAAFSNVEVMLIWQVVYSYFACVYYRRSLFLSPDRFLNYRGKPRVVLLALIQGYVILVVTLTIYFLEESAQSAENFLPPDLQWARNRSVHMFIQRDENMRNLAVVSYSGATIFTTIIVSMLMQLVREVKRSVRKASIPTRRYQHLAVRSLILQGAVPSLVYLVPSQGNTFLQFAPILVECGEKFDRIASYMSPVIWFLMTKHTFVSSLTILYCSSSYRRKIHGNFIRPLSDDQKKKNFSKSVKI